MNARTRGSLLTAAGMCLLLLLIAPPRAAAQTDPVTDLLGKINGLRSSLGLAPYTLDPILRSAAQAHSEWGASVGYLSHDGPDGSRPTDRAIRAGYGAAGAIRVSENIYYGSMATPDSAFNWWLNSSIHYAGMTNPDYQDIGIGVAYSDSGGYFTLMFGTHVSAAAASGSASGGGAASGPQAEPAAEPDIPEIATAEPQADGSIIHVVDEGQAIWNISAAYSVPIPDLFALNNLAEGSFIHAGDRIVVRPASTPTPTVTPTLPPTATRPPTLTPLVVAAYGDQPAAESSRAQGAAAILPAISNDTRHTLRSIFRATLVLGVGLILVGVVVLRLRTAPWRDID